MPAANRSWLTMSCGLIAHTVAPAPVPEPHLPG